MARILVFIIVFWCTPIFAASFDCRKAVSLAEMMICNDPKLSELDEELGGIYKRAKDAAKDKDAFAKQSRESLKWRDAYCHTRECLTNWYAQRKIALNNIPKEGFLVNAANSIHLSFDEASEGHDFWLNGIEGTMFPSKIIIYYYQTGLRLVATFGEDVHVRIPYSFDVGYESDGEMKWEKRGNKYAIAQHDITGDGIDEILFAVLVEDDAMSQAEVNVFKFYPPQRRVDLGRKENWSLIGDVQATGIHLNPQIKINDQSITIPRNFRGFYNEITWVKNGFIDTGND